MVKEFKDVENKFHQLKRLYKQKKISNREYKDRLKNLRLKDEKGKYWTVGARTGKWYYFDGQNWVEAKPPTILDGKSICIYCGHENDLETEVCLFCGGGLKQISNICPKCGTKKDDPNQECPSCLREKQIQEKLEEIKEKEIVEEDMDQYFPDKKDFNYVFHSVNPLSFFFFFGAIGLLSGIIFGSFAGASTYFPGIAKIFPSFLHTFQGKLLGGALYGILGGLSCFIIIGGVGFLLALLINLILSFFGGVKIRMEKI
jgi:hypothetical protein